MYNEWFTEIEYKCAQIKDYAERIEFLYDEKSNFITHNRGVEANQIILKFDNLIEREKSLYGLNQTNANNSQTESEDLPDYSNNSKAERIVFLHKLGILEYLHNKMKNELHYFAPNKLAQIVSTFTDISQPTAQSYLNPLYSKEVDESKSPLTDRNLKKVKQKLKDIGFSI